MNMLKQACKWGKIQHEEADSMSLTWSQFVPGWRKTLLAYKQDNKRPNPFEEPDPSKFTHEHVISFKLNCFDRWRIG